MKFILPIYYSEYGRYITRFRAIPFYIDALIPVQRRLLLSVYEVAKDKFVKSAKIIGYATGTYHPHGDQAAYGTLVKLVQQGYCDKQGNWGSDGLDDAPPAAFRYTECKLSKWVKELAFKYIEYVPWDNFEYENEPLYLPSPIPLGLIGHGIYTGIAFHKSNIPKYSLSDLSKRLVSLLKNEENKPIIIPKANGCDVVDKSNNTNFISILESGVGNISYIPHGEMLNNKFRIKGRAPNTKFTKLIEDSDVSEKNKTKILPITLTDLSKKGINIEVNLDKKKNIDINKVAQYVWEKYLIKSKNINIVTCNENGNIIESGIDQLLLTNYNAWQYAVWKKNIHDAEKLIYKKKEMNIIFIIRQIIDKYSCKTINDIIHYFNTNYNNTVIPIDIFNYNTNNWDTSKITITDIDIKEICNRKSIRSLIEIDLDINQIDKLINDQKIKILNTNNECFNELLSYQ